MIALEFAAERSASAAERSPPALYAALTLAAWLIEAMHLQHRLP
jgi:hypothetical protein